MTGAVISIFLATSLAPKTMSDEVVINIIILSIAIIFAIASFFHATVNAFMQKNQSFERHLIVLYLASLISLSIVTVIYSLSVLRRLEDDLYFVVAVSGCIHLARLAVDLMDGAGSRNLKVVARHGVDAGGNLVTILFVLSVAAHRNWLLAWAALFLSFGLVGKELYYRLWLDLEQRNKNERKTAQGGAGTATNPRIGAYHALANSTKSLWYVFVGFCLIYCSVATINNSYVNLIFQKGLDRRIFIQAFIFTIKNVKDSIEGDFSSAAHAYIVGACVSRWRDSLDL